MLKGWQNGWVYGELQRHVMRKITTVIALLIAFAIIVLPLALYFINFGLNPDLSFNFTLAKSLDDWSAFGGFSVVPLDQSFRHLLLSVFGSLIEHSGSKLDSQKAEQQSMSYRDYLLPRLMPLRTS